MFWKLLLLESDKVSGRLLLWIELGILAIIIVIVDLFEYFVALALTPAQGQVLLQSLEWPNGLVAATNFAGSHSLGGILLVIVVAVVTAREYTWRTFHLWLSRGISRLALMGAKCVITIAIAILLVVTSIVVGVILTGIITLAQHGSLQLSSDNIQHLVLNFLATDLGLLPYAALTLMFTILFRNSVVSIGIGLVLLLLVESAAFGILSIVNATTQSIAVYLPIGLEEGLQQAIIGGPSPTGPGVPHFLPPVLCCIYLFVYAAIFAGLGVWRFTRQNFTD
jgi:ABC-type transport system involved in multi-copper enzyme maturation permease subunit